MSCTIFAGVYLRPTSHHMRYSEFSNSVVNVFEQYPSNKICITGAFSLPHIYWSPNTPTILHGCIGGETMSFESLMENFDLCGLAQFNEFCNDSGSMFDLCFASDCKTSMSLALDPLISCDKYHPSLFAIISEGPHVDSNPPQNQSFKYDFNHGDYLGINGYFGSVIWVFRSVDIGVAINLLYEWLFQSTGYFIPKRMVYASTFSKWFTPGLIKLCK